MPGLAYDLEAQHLFNPTCQEKDVLVLPHVENRQDVNTLPTSLDAVTATTTTKPVPLVACQDILLVPDMSENMANCSINKEVRRSSNLESETSAMLRNVQAR